jgi:hypothetical protein
MRVRPGLGALLATISLSSCGGDSGGQALGAAEFRQQADAICEKYNAQFRALASPFEESDEAVLDPLEPSTAQALQTYLSKTIPLIEDQTAEFERIHPPGEFKDEWNRVMELQRQGVAKTRDLQDALRQEDIARIRATLEESEAVAKEGRRLADTLGLANCGQS